MSSTSNLSAASTSGPPQPQRTQGGPSRRGRGRATRASTRPIRSEPAPVTVNNTTRQISLYDFSDSSDDEVIPEIPPDAVDLSALDAWGLRPEDSPPSRNAAPNDSYSGHTGLYRREHAQRGGRGGRASRGNGVDWYTPPSLVVDDDQNLQGSSTPQIKRDGAPRVPSLQITCPLCLENAVDLTSTPCGHVGCGSVSNGFCGGGLYSSNRLAVHAQERKVEACLSHVQTANHPVGATSPLLVKCFYFPNVSSYFRLLVSFIVPVCQLECVVGCIEYSAVVMYIFPGGFTARTRWVARVSLACRFAEPFYSCGSSGFARRELGKANEFEAALELRIAE